MKIYYLQTSKKKIKILLFHYEIYSNLLSLPYRLFFEKTLNIKSNKIKPKNFHIFSIFLILTNHIIFTLNIDNLQFKF